MSELENILKNPLVRTGLKVAAPEISLAVDLVSTITKSLFASRSLSATAKVVAMVSEIDKQLATMIEELATTEDVAMRKELEIRVHTLLGVILEWDKIS